MPGKHVSQYPKWRIRKPRHRIRAIFIKETTNGEPEYYIETGDTRVRVYDHHHFKRLVVTAGIDCYIGNILTEYPWLQEASRDKQCTINVAKDVIVSIKFHCDGMGNKTGTLTSTTSWGVRSPSKTFLKALRIVQKEYGYGVYATPGSLGRAGLQTHLQNKHIRVSRPSVMLRRILLENTIGGRVDTPKRDKVPPDTTVVYDEDQNCSYPHAACETIDPTHTPVYFPKSSPKLDNYYAYYARAFVRIPPGEDASKGFGVLPVRNELSSEVTFVTEPETYIGWWWKATLDRCKSLGYDVDILEAYAWKKSSTFMATWSKEIFATITRLKCLRDSSSEENKDIYEMAVDMMKIVGVSTIGSHGMHPETRTLVHESNYQKGDIALVDPYAHSPNPFTDYYIRVTSNPDAEWLTHVYSFILDVARNTTWDRIQAHIANGTVVLASRVDSITTLQPGLLHVSDSEFGGWKRKALDIISGYAVFGDRGKGNLVTRQKLRLPGRDQSHPTRKRIQEALRL